MKTLAAVAGGLTLERVAVLAAEAVRLDAVKLREAALTPSPSPSGRGELVGRPEYLYLRNALWKEKIYAQWRYRDAVSRRRAAAGWRKWLDGEEQKRVRAEAWLDFDPDSVPVNLEYLPDF